MSGIVLPGAIIPTFFLLQRLNLINTYTGVIVVLLSMTMPVSVFLYTGFMKSVPKELDEAGIIDGCGKLRLFFVIILPLLRPATITVMIFNFMGVWNDVTTQLYFSNADKWTMPMMVYRFQGMYSSQWNLIFADLILTSIPVVLVYIIGQKYMVSGLTTGAVKG
jgi:raffinose/stachyose/melibiose transport system permease protein